MATFGTFVAGQVLTAAELNTAGSWDSYTPTFTQSATITKTTNWARYTQLGKWVQGSVKLTASSAGTANNKVLVGLPVAASSNNFIIGSMVYFDTGASEGTYIYQPLAAFFDSSTAMSFTVKQAGSRNIFVPDNDKRFGENFTYGGGTAASGITVASGDIIYVQFAYEAA